MVFGFLSHCVNAFAGFCYTESRGERVHISTRLIHLIVCTTLSAVLLSAAEGMPSQRMSSLKFQHHLITFSARDMYLAVPPLSRKHPPSC